MTGPVGLGPVVRVCVFCGKSDGARPAYAAAATELGRHLADSGVGLVTGGGGRGLMRHVADGALAAGGEVIGIMPRALQARGTHPGLSQLEIVSDMHTRKARMGELATVFVALPGGIGTLEEIVEAWTWAQLGLRRKPCGLLNTEGFYTPLITMAGRMVDDGFLPGSDRELLVVDPDPRSLVAALLATAATAA